MNRNLYIITIVLLLTTIITIIGDKAFTGLRHAGRMPMIPILKSVSFLSNAVENKHLLNAILNERGHNNIALYRQQSLENENKQLRRILKLKMNLAHNLITSEILANSIDNNGYLIIDKGTAHGVHKQMGVMFLDGIIGKIIESDPGNSLIETYMNINFKISLTDKNGMMFFIGRSNGQGGLIIDNAEIISLKINDTLFTSGLGKLFPASIPVGQVKSIETNEQNEIIIIDMFQSLNTDFVFIISDLNDNSNEMNGNNPSTIGKVGWYQIKRI